MDKLPIELLNKIFLYKPVPPHYLAFKTGLRFVSDNELFENISDSDIKIRTEEDELNEEWEEFQNAEELFSQDDIMFYLQNDIPLPAGYAGY